MWYVIQVRTGTEEEIQRQCETIIDKNILEKSFIPKYERERKYQGKWHTELKVLFPGYVFLVSDEKEKLFFELKRIIGLTKLLGTGKTIVPLTDEEVNFLLRLGGEEQTVEMSEGIIENDRMVVTSGPLKGNEGLIRKIDRHKRKAWLEIEMGTNFDSANVDMIKTPVVSSIVNRLSFGNDSSLTEDQKDDRLVELIKYVDAVDAGGTPALPTYAAEATVENDIAIVTEARHYSYMAGGTDHQAYIPSYSQHIREAKEFLKFMYSDRGLQIYYESMQGAMLPAMLTEGSYDASGMQLSGFRESVNAAQLDGFVYDREPTARYFVLPHISACFENGVSPVVALRGGDSAMDIITDNRNSIGSRWETIAGLLGSDYINS